MNYVCLIEGFALKHWIGILKALKYLKILNEFDIIGRRTFRKLKKEGNSDEKVYDGGNPCSAYA